MLPDAETSTSLTASSSPRSAAEAFVRGTTQGWGRRELAEWLVCHYGACARGSTREQPEARVREPESARRTVEERTVEALVRSARREVLRILYDLGDPDAAPAHARLAIARGLVGVDRAGGRAWVPLNGPRLGLVDRVASLLFADYLNCPLDYRGIVVCRGCGGIGFAGAHGHTEGCQPKRYDSGIALCEVEAAPDTLRSGSFAG